MSLPYYLAHCVQVARNEGWDGTAERAEEEFAKAADAAFNEALELAAKTADEQREGAEREINRTGKDAVEHLAYWEGRRVSASMLATAIRALTRKP